MLFRALGVLLLALLLGRTAQAQPPDYPPDGLTCRSYLLYDITDERVVAVQKGEARQPIASLTKLMTAIVAVDNLRFDGRYILSPEEAKLYSVDTMRADKMLEMMMVCSNNKMCSVVARRATRSTSDDAFVKLMNDRARELGLKSTHFANPSGLPGGEQYSTMWDVLVLLRTAWGDARIRSAMCEDCVNLAGKDYDGTLADLYARHPNLLGGKTGYTNAAGRCLALLYRGPSGHDYALISFGSKGVKSSFRDAELLLKHYGLYSGPVGEWK